ncbi:MAG: chemotaxis protein CheA [Proteobacteria bacterium]|nr:chemotaxis protein CheA [Pseudomonadota bacterium]MBU4471532.1 chemotaxis protein CheA [Pseudomonadota bacterium]MCG2752538.1 chemotaxis protein CheA [Desulfobacteraceae bacterium]
MKSVEQEHIQVLSGILESVETISLNDRGAWDQVNEKINIIFHSLTNEHENLKEALILCAEGVGLISESKCTNPLSLIDALYALLESISKCFLNISTNNGDIDLPLRNLKLLLGEDKNPEASRAANSIQEDNTRLLLNDAAMTLIQLEKGDVEGLGLLTQALAAIISEPCCKEQVRNSIKNALSVIEEIEVDDMGAWDIHISEVNNLLDEAILFDTRKTERVFHDEDESDINPMLENQPFEATVKAEQTIINGSAPTMQKNEKLQNTFPEPKGKASLSANPTEGTKDVVDDGKDYMPKDPDLEMLGEFISESIELITNAEEALLSLEVNPDDKESIGTVFRAFHTVKGTSAFLELSLLSGMAHHAENLLSRVRDNEIRYSGGYADLSLKSLDMLKELVHLVQKAIEGEPLKKPKGYDELVTTLSNPEAEGISEEFDEEESPRVGDILVARGKVTREEIEETVSQHANKPLGEALVHARVSNLQDVGQALRTQTKLKGVNKQQVESTVRVGTHRLDKLVDMVGEMVIAYSMIAQDDIVAKSHNHALQKKVTQTGKIVRELQDLSMSMRMIPLKATFQKMARLVRDVCRKVGKNVNLVTEGEETEIDRNLVDYLNDPLVHMVRNSVDHGIESPEERIKSGKSPVGTIKLSAYHSGGNVVMEISDDGKGLNKDLILKKAIERNLIEKGKILTDREIFNLIFEPGFSTAETVTDVSGRGVGMDVVRKNIETLRGQIEITSEPGKGSVFKIFLPLTLAIIDGMVIRVANETYVLPTESIIRSIKPDPKDISTVFNEGKVLSIQGRLIPLFKLSDLYDIDLKGKNDDLSLIVIVEDDSSQAGIIIDELVGRQQVVVKSLGESMRGIPGISGGAIMPNGRVGLIIDVGGLVRMVHEGIDSLKQNEPANDKKMRAPN